MNNHLIIRLALPNERELLEDLQWRASLQNEGDREALLTHPDAIALPIDQIEAGQVWVAEYEGVIAGFAVLLPRYDRQMELDGLFVDPDLWKLGIGRALLHQCCLSARDLGASVLYVTGNPHAQGFYRACGFILIGTEETRFGPGLLMRKGL